MLDLPSSKPTAEESDERMNILVVDDRPDKMLAMETILEELGQNIVTANSGTEALRCLLQKDFAVILLDVNMPGMDGFETAALIRQRPRSETTPIIFVSAVNDTENHVSRGYSLGAVDYILSPIVPEILRAKVAVFVDLFKKTEQIKRQAEQEAEFIRARAARVEAEAAQERLAFLAEAGSVLACSLDHQEIFERLAHLLVPKVGDYCTVDILDERQSWRHVAFAHWDPECEGRLKATNGPCGGGPCLSPLGAHVFKTGKPEVHTPGDEDSLRILAASDEQLQLIRQMNLTGSIVAPIVRLGETVGIISLLSCHRTYGIPEISLSEALAERVVLALDNADLYQAAQKARQEAERANLAKDQFLAMLSHELRTPLTPVLASVLALEEEKLSSGMRSALEMIRRNVELEARLIDDLLDLTRISRGKLQLNLEVVDAHVLLRNVLEICQAEIKEERLTLELDLAATRTHLRADSARLQQIFWNLIKNAVKFTPHHGRLTVTSCNMDDLLQIEIADSGVGIEPNLISKIFDAFEQGERLRHGGLGLGLAITKALVELHTGKIVAQSSGKDMGSKFTLLLPTTHEAPAKASQPSPEAGQTAAQRASVRILLVEDHEDTNRSLTFLLRRRGYQVQSARNVQAALELAETEQFDVLISDMGLPDGSGLDVMNRGFAGEASVLGIALSGFGMESDIRNSLDAGFRHHLIKPVDLNRLDEIIQRDAAKKLAGKN